MASGDPSAPHSDASRPVSISESAFLSQGAAAIAARFDPFPRLVFVLGSGLKGFAANLQDADHVPFRDVPHWPVPQVAGHGAELVVGRLNGQRVACLTGRVHLYEGWHPSEVVRPLRTLRLVGAETVLLTNAAGGIADGMRPGDLMVLRDHLNLTGQSPLVGPAEEALGPRFPDQSAVYHPDLRAALHRLDGNLREGVYAGLLGPSYETPAEVQMLNRLGADAVGMSTVHEAVAANAMGMRIAGISLISNLAAGISERPLDHQEVLDAGQLAADRLTDLVTRFAKEVAGTNGD